MKVEAAVRVFKHGAMELEDPDSSQTPDEVKEFYARVYPELTNAEIEGPEHKGAKTIYEFRRAVGTKGIAPLRVEFEIGRTRHGQELRLIHERGGERGGWTIRKEPASQRDDLNIITGIDTDVLLRIGEIARTFKP